MTILLMRCDELAEWDYRGERLTRTVARGLLVRVRPGVYANGEEWTTATPEERIVARARAVTLQTATPPIVSHETAAALHGLPLHRPAEDRIHVIAPSIRPGAARQLVRHRGELDDDEIVVIDGVHCTSLGRTVADLARTATPERAVVAADAALRSLCVTHPGSYDSERAAEFRELARSTAHRSAHGRLRAERVLAFADGRAQRPGESISRIRLADLGFARIGLQAEVPSPSGGRYYIDFDLEDAPAFGEFDGRGKYFDARFAGDRSPESVLDAEKHREDWIRGLTQRPFVRWGWKHISSTAALGARLAAFGIHPPATAVRGASRR